MDQVFTTCSEITAPGKKISASCSIIFSLFTVFQRSFVDLPMYENIRKLCSCVFSMKQTLQFAQYSPRLRQRVVMCQLSCFSKKNQLFFALILVRLDRYIPLRVLLKPENSSKNLHVRMDNKKCNTNLGSTDQSCHPTWISNRRWHNYLSSWIYDKSFKIGLWHSNQSS